VANWRVVLVAAFLIGCAAIAICIGVRQPGFRW
jgi:hypothetical protein